jgi:branched-chain amino acid transport system permease protein
MANIPNFQKKFKVILKTDSNGAKDVPDYTTEVGLNRLVKGIARSLRVITAGFLIMGGLFAAAPANAEDIENIPDITAFSIGGIIRDGETPIEGVRITVAGESFEEVGITQADGRWAVSIPGKGDYTITLDTASLPEGASLRDASKTTKSVTVDVVNTVNVLFPLNDTTTVTTGPGAEESAGEVNLFLGRLIAGLNLGVLLAMAAIGLSLIYGTTALNNFAHGEMVTLGALLAFTFNKLMGLDLVLSALLTMVLVAASGWLQDASIWRPLRKRRVGLTQMMIVSIGLSLAVRYVFQIIYGGDTKVLSQGEIWDIFGIPTLAVNVISAGIAVVILLLVALFLTKTRIGKATRAVSDNPSLAAASGIDVEKIIRIVWIVAGALTGISGVMLGLFNQTSWDMGFSILLLLFAAVTLGGLGTAFGAAVGAMVVGLFVELSTLVIPSDLKFAGALIILILVLLVRPQGILGKAQRIG